MMPTNVEGWSSTRSAAGVSFLRKVEKYPSQTTVRGARNVWVVFFASLSASVGSPTAALTPPITAPSTHSFPSTSSSFLTVACLQSTCFSSEIAASLSRITNRPLWKLRPATSSPCPDRGYLITASPSSLYMAYPNTFCASISSTQCARPSSFNFRYPPGCSSSPTMRTGSLRSRSNRSTFRPSLPRAYARLAPATPAPTIITSHSCADAVASPPRPILF
mmetsp:Transcript_3077/g.10726  ORF Transcript_3077/g.10726 Transcript_3077/m.10726 type:complete len:220 (+) Transcript_3077:905-1564(+)